tara:strand:- start:316 stop:744 length:429 start_codon:yes stop_codon:yes gene_type:complete
MKKILIINANYYKEISNKLISSAKLVLKKNNFKLDIVNVPGVFEIPYMLNKYIKKYDGFLVLGCVIKGETPHFDFICRSTFDSILNISIKNNKPVGNGIITSLSLNQALDRCSNPKESTKPNKGLESANAVIAVLTNEPEKS